MSLICNTDAYIYIYMHKVSIQLLYTIAIARVYMYNIYIYMYIHMHKYTHTLHILQCIHIYIYIYILTHCIDVHYIYTHQKHYKDQMLHMYIHTISAHYTYRIWTHTHTYYIYILPAIQTCLFILSFSLRIWMYMLCMCCTNLHTLSVYNYTFYIHNTHIINRTIYATIFVHT